MVSDTEFLCHGSGGWGLTAIYNQLSLDDCNTDSNEDFLFTSKALPAGVACLHPKVQSAVFQQQYATTPRFYHCSFFAMQVFCTREQKNQRERRRATNLTKSRKAPLTKAGAQASPHTPVSASSQLPAFL
jgi:hypothetical protein